MSSGSIDPIPIELYSDADIEKEFELIKKSSWIDCSEIELNLEFKKTCINDNLKRAKRIHDTIKAYMETDEYKNGIYQFENMTPDEAFLYCHESIGGLYIEHSDDEKRALAVKSVAKRTREREEEEKYMPKNEFIPNTEYIFFSIDFADFATRMILVPKKEFTEIYADKLDMLRINSEKTHEENGIIINELVTYYEQTSENGWSEISNEFTQFAHGMRRFAECESERGAMYGVLGDECSIEQMDIDRTWYIKSVCCGYVYFNPQTGKMNLTEEALSKGCTVSECFLFSDVTEDRECRKEYEYDTVNDYTDSFIMGSDCNDGW